MYFGREMDAKIYQKFTYLRVCLKILLFPLKFESHLIIKRENCLLNYYILSSFWVFSLFTGSGIRISGLGYPGHLNANHSSVISKYGDHGMERWDAGLLDSTEFMELYKMNFYTTIFFFFFFCQNKISRGIRQS